MHDAEGLIFSIAPQNRFKLDSSFLARYRDKQPKWGPLGEVTFLRTYSRRVVDPATGRERNEYFWEACQRVVEGAFSILKQHQRNHHLRFDDVEGQRKAQDMFERMFAFKWLPPGRGMSFMGTKAIELKGGAALNNCGFVSTKDIDVEFAEPFCALMDFSMLGVGMGFDVRGKGKVRVLSPVWDPIHPFVVEDTREGWIAALRVVLDAYAGKGRLPTMFDYSKVRPEGAPLKTFGGTSSGPEPLRQLLDAVSSLLAKRNGQLITTTDIVDIMNLIGKCVVAGNVRRSSEIALGDPDDAEFVALKDPAGLTQLYARQGQIETRIDKAVEAQVEMDAARVEQKFHSPLAEEYAVWQTEINRWKAVHDEACRANPDWMAVQQEIDAHPLMSHRWASNNTVLCSPRDLFDKLADMTIRNGEPGYGFMDTIRAYGRLSDPPNFLDEKAEGFNPCAEQTLWNNELCCLVETFPTNHADLDDYKATLKMAYLYAKIVTLVPTHRPATNAVMVRNRRIGTSMAGVFEMYEKLGLQECTRWWDESYRFLLDLDHEYSGWMGIAQSIKVSSIKPGGTIPLLAGKEGGMKLPSYKFGFRTIRVGHDSPLVAAHRNAGYRVEKDITTPRTMVIYFPVKNEVERTAHDVSIWEQLELCASLQAFWADNMVSATITFQKHEAKDLKFALRAFAHRLKAISFLPLTDHKYAQAPYIECTEAEYLAAKAAIRPLPDLYEDGGAVPVHEVDDKFCDGGACEIRRENAESALT